MRMAVRIASLVVAGTLVLLAGLGAAGLLGVKLPFQSTTIDRSQPALLKSIQDISQFHAAVGNFEVVLDQEDDVNWVPSFIAGERSLFVAAGTVNAYVDFSGLGEGDLTLSDDGKSVEIRLPGGPVGQTQPGPGPDLLVLPGTRRDQPGRRRALHTGPARALPALRAEDGIRRG